jgi:mono/diheme cytochrome c family protein
LTGPEFIRYLDSMNRFNFLFVLFAFLIVAALAAGQPPKKAPEPIGADHAEKMVKGLDVFKKHVKPILESKCLRCHGGKKIESDFDLSDREGLLKGGQIGNSVIAGKSKESQLVKLIQHAKEPHMPEGGPKLSDAAIAKISEWIDLGAPYDNPLVPSKLKGKSWTERVLPASAKQWWAFQPLSKTAPPAVKNGAWVKTSIDRFILAKLEEAKIAPNQPATKEQLIRHAYFDLIGLPPAPEDVQAFLEDCASAKPQAAFERMIDKLLASPHYGERWGRHWLDLARFAESHGFEHDTDRPTAYHYRDFVIEALNQDLPYDKFVQWQIAGDEFEPENTLALKATGFLAAGVHSTQITKNEVEKHRYDEMDDKLSTITTAMLGLTVGCARCHDHKYDPIPQRDYYRMLATFTTTVRSEVEVKPATPEYAQAKAAFDLAHQPFVARAEKFAEEQLPARLADWEKSGGAKAKVPANVAAILKTQPAERKPQQQADLLKWYRTIDPEAKKLDQQEKEHAKKAPPAPKMLVATEGLPAVRLHTQGDDFFPQTFFLRRGDPANKEGTATQGFLQVLMPSVDAAKRWQSEPPAGWRTSYRRRAFAAWLTDVDNGAGQLLARVIVNRLWQHHMGRGIVATPSDFGARGERPTHPELLDHLANELIKNGWRLKPIHKLIMTSAVYQESTQVDPAKVKHDRDNKLYWRQPARRLEAEIIRDSILSVSGELDPRMFGPGTLDEKSKRRSIYFTVKRSKLVPMMVIFDAPEALSGMAERPTTTIAPQALHLLNNPQVRQAARSMARRISPDSTTPLENAVRQGYRIALARDPDRDELFDGVAFIQKQLPTYPETTRRESALADFCQVLLCLNEFIYVD